MEPVGADFSYFVIGEAMSVHSELGPGLDERPYHELMSRRLKRAGWEHLSKPREPLYHRGLLADLFEPDIVFPSAAVLEFKMLVGDFARKHFAQLFSYLKRWGISTGFLFDFGKQSLFWRRVEYEPVRLTQEHLQEVERVFLLEGCGGLMLRKVLSSIIQIAREYGLGYRDRTYRGLLAADMSADGLECVWKPNTAISVGEEILGRSNLDCLLVENQVAVRVMALNDTITAADRAMLQTCLKHLGLDDGIIVNFGKKALEARYVRAPKESKQRGPRRIVPGETEQS